jgi:ABC-type cobalamin/Fe3+-siderophores transport system ATPase subunit
MDALLSLREVSLSFARGRRHVISVFSNISLDIYAGELVAVLAQRAQGKTALVRLAGGFDRPSRGKVLFRGEDLCQAPDRRRSELLRYCISFAEPGGPDLEVSAVTYVAASMFSVLGKRTAYDRAREALDRVDAGELAEQEWTAMSDSERALVALAQGIVRKPALLLVDDLTAMLGIEVKELIGRTLRTIAEEEHMAVLMSASHADATTWFDRVATISSGELLLPPPEPQQNVIDFDQARRAGW